MKTALQLFFALVTFPTSGALSNELNFEDISRSPDFIAFEDVMPEGSQNVYECVGFTVKNECDDYFHVLRKDDKILKIGILRLRENNGVLIKVVLTGKVINGYLCADYGRSILNVSHRKSGENENNALINVLRPSFAKFGTICSAYFREASSYRIKHFNKDGNVAADFLPKFVRFQPERPKLFSLFEDGKKS